MAAASGSSSGSYSPFGIDQAPSSLRAQNGPPGWTSRTSVPPLRCRRMPALGSFEGTSRGSWRAVADEVAEIAVRVQPRARRTEVAGERGGAILIRVTAPPVDG